MKAFSFFIFYIFIVLSGFSQYATRQVLQEEEPGRQHYFGSSGDIDGDLAVIVSTHGRNPLAWNGGLAYVYQLKDDNWKLRNTLYSKISSDNDRFGQNACDMHKKRIIIGDWMNTLHASGAAHIFELTADTSWTHVTTLTPKIKDKYKRFGNRVAIYGNTAAIGTYSEVFIFEIQNGKWIQTQVLKGESQESTGFGMEMALFDNQLIIGSRYEDIEGVQNLGAVYVYAKKNGKWVKQQKILANKEDWKEELEFGTSIAVSDKLLALGVPKKNMGKVSGAGAVYLYRKNEGKWQFSQLLYNERFGRNIYRFGTRVSISNDFIAVTESQDKEYNPSVFVYQIVNDKPKLISKIQEPEAVESNRFATDFIAISGNHLLTGDGNDSFCDDSWGNCGKGYFYKINEYKQVDRKNSEAYASNFGFSASEINRLKKKFNGDLIVFDDVNGDLVFKMRNKETGKWGMYQGDKNIIPAEFDTIQFYGWNDPYTILGKDGLFGIYTSAFGNDGKLSVPCRYEDFKTYTYEGQYWLAGQRDGKWRWVNWFWGNEHSMEADYHQELFIMEKWNPGQ